MDIPPSPTSVSIFRILRHVTSLLCRPLLDGLWFGRHLPWDLRWRLLLFAPLSIPINATVSLRYLFSRPFVVDYIPVGQGRELRVLVFKAPRPTATRQGDIQDDTRDGAQDDTAVQPRPLHVDCHAGGFIGGYPESSAPFCALLARETGAVVVSLSYRLAPVNPFPAAIDDVDAALAWLQRHAPSRYGADPTLTTVSGCSAGGNLVLAASQAASQALACRGSADTAIRASVTFYAPLDMRLAPWEKAGFADLPRPDPGAFLMPLYHSYAALSHVASAGNNKIGDDVRLSPGLAAIQTLPKRMLLVVPGVDVLVKEQLDFVERVKREGEVMGDGPVVEAMFLGDAFHGYLEVPDAVVSREKKMQMWRPGLDFIRQTHKEHGWRWTLD